MDDLYTSVKSRWKVWTESFLYSSYAFQPDKLTRYKSSVITNSESKQDNLTMRDRQRTRFALANVLLYNKESEKAL